MKRLIFIITLYGLYRFTDYWITATTPDAVEYSGVRHGGLK